MSFENYKAWMEEVEQAKKDESYEYKKEFVDRCIYIAKSTGRRCVAVACRHDGGCDMHAEYKDSKKWGKYKDEKD